MNRKNLLFLSVYNITKFLFSENFAINITNSNSFRVLYTRHIFVFLTGDLQRMKSDI